MLKKTPNSDICTQEHLMREKGTSPALRADLPRRGAVTTPPASRADPPGCAVVTVALVDEAPLLVDNV